MKRIIAILLVLTVMLTGCQLAREEEQVPEGQDKLIGVMITPEHLNLFDMESYLNDHLDEIMEDEDHVISGDTSKYEGRIYADMTDGNCEFPGIEGFLLAYYEIDAVTWRATPCLEISEAFCDMHTEENRTTMDITGTIYLSERAEEFCYFYNPVYQTADGKVYLTAGQGSSGNILEGAGITTTHSLSAKYENSDGESYAASVKITVKTMTMPEKYVLIAMDEKHQELSRTEYAPEEIPDEITVPSGVAYLLVESHSTDENGETVVTRTIHSPDDTFQTLEVFTEREDYVCVKTYPKINWE